MTELVTLLEQLVAIDSVNPDLVPGGAGEAEIAAFVSSWLARAGLEVELDEPRPGRPSVIARARGTGGGRSLMLNAHLDTVGVAGMESPHRARQEGQRLYGRGAFDMKGSLAAIMLAAATAATRQLRGDVIVTAVADEEYASTGMDSVAKRVRADAAIVTEPTSLQLCIAHRGFVWLEVETRGRAAHGSRPDLGIDAIVQMGHVLCRIGELQQTLAAARGHPLLGNGSVHASLIQGGQELSSYPERCNLKIERRTIPGEDSTDAVRELEAILTDLAATEPGLDASVNTIFERAPFQVAEDEDIVHIVRRQARNVLEEQPELTGHPAWMDAAILSAAGTPTVVIGPGGDGAHAIVEWVDLADVAKLEAILARTIEDFCT